MKSTSLVFGSFLFLACFAPTSMAQVQRTFVSGLGTDANPCSRTAPCRTFAQAILGTNAGGEVVVLDSAGYGPFSIAKSISIIAPPGVYAGISTFSGDGIDINAGGSDTVILRGLTINNQANTPIFNSGIVFNTGGTLHVENGLFFAGAGNLEVKDSIFRGDAHGINVGLNGPARAAIDQVRLEACSTGVFAGPGSKVTVRNCLASDNGTAFECFTGTSAAAELNIEGCVAFAGADGVKVSAGSTGVATVRVSNSTITDNGTFGLLNQNLGGPSFLLSRGNNTVEGNATNTSGTIGSYTAN